MALDFPRGPFGIIYADPPWRYRDDKGGRPALGGFTYPSMTDQELAALPVRCIADRNALLFLWATMPKLPEALALMRAWEFNYTCCAFTWVKLNPKGEGVYSGIGHWTNGNAELCLLGKRGRPQRQARNVKQIVMAPRGRHSAKPAEVRSRIVALAGDLPRIELFARERAPGWEAWGNEV